MGSIDDAAVRTIAAVRGMTAIKNGVHRLEHGKVAARVILDFARV